MLLEYSGAALEQAWAEQKLCGRLAALQSLHPVADGGADSVDDVADVSSFAEDLYAIDDCPSPCGLVLTQIRM